MHLSNWITTFFAPFYLFRFFRNTLCVFLVRCVQRWNLTRLHNAKLYIYMKKRTFHLLILTVYIFCVSLVAFRYAYMKKSRDHCFGKIKCELINIGTSFEKDVLKRQQLNRAAQDVRHIICLICLVIISPSFLYILFIFPSLWMHSAHTHRASRNINYSTSDLDALQFKRIFFSRIIQIEFFDWNNNLNEIYNNHMWADFNWTTVSSLTTQWNLMKREQKK